MSRKSRRLSQFIFSVSALLTWLCTLSSSFLVCVACLSSSLQCVSAFSNSFMKIPRAALWHSTWERRSRSACDGWKSKEAVITHATTHLHVGRISETDVVLQRQIESWHEIKIQITFPLKKKKTEMFNLHIELPQEAQSRDFLGQNGQVLWPLAERGRVPWEEASRERWRSALSWFRVKRAEVRWISDSDALLCCLLLFMSQKWVGKQRYVPVGTCYFPLNHKLQSFSSDCLLTPQS